MPIRCQPTALLRVPTGVVTVTRVVFFGTPRPAADCLRALVGAGHDIAAVYTRPDRVAGRSREPQPTPVKEAGLELGHLVRTPASLRGDDVRDDLAALDPAMFVVLAYGRILPPGLLDLPPRGVLNVHPSLLPLYRGPSPVVSAIRDGERETGVSVMLLDEGMDTGPVIARSAPVPITETDTAGALTDRLFAIGVELMIETIPAWEEGTLTAEPQDDEAATVTRLVEKADGEMNFDEAATALSRAVRAYDPWPGTFTRWTGKILKVLEASIISSGPDTPGAPGSPGTVTVDDGRILIATGSGVLEVKRLQLEGKAAVTAAEFLRGYPAIEGAHLPS